MKARTIILTGFSVCILLGACGKSNETSTAELDGKAPSSDVIWYEDWNKGIEAAKKEHKPVFVHFTADWCKYCVQMKKETYAAPEIKNRFNNGWITIMIDTEDMKKTGSVYLDEAKKSAMVYLQGEQGDYKEKVLNHKQLLSFFGGSGLPTLLFIDKEGMPVQKIPGFIPKEEFGVILDYFKEEAYKKNISFDDFKKNKG